MTIQEAMEKAIETGKDSAFAGKVNVYRPIESQPTYTLIATTKEWRYDRWNTGKYGYSFNCRYDMSQGEFGSRNDGCEKQDFFHMIPSPEDIIATDWEVSVY